jgi:ferritin-like metal-binding protein YciE
MSNDQLVAWLHDAHAMESGLIPILQHHADGARAAMPDAAVRLDQHVVETRLHIDRIEQCLHDLGTTTSTAKSTFSSLLGSIESVATGLFADEQVKNVVMDYGAEQFEVGCYRALVAAARQLGHGRVADLCELNLREDEAMATWLRDQIPVVVTRALGLAV